MTGNKVTPSRDITISKNNVLNCKVGIIDELNNCLICKNILNDLGGLGIQLFIKNITFPISNNKVAAPCSFGEIL